MPAFLNAYIVRPEQSNPAGVVPPDAYGVPTRLSATCIAAVAPWPTEGAARVLGAAGATAAGSMPIAFSVAVSGEPSAGRPLAASQRLSAALVCGPITPSAVTPSLAWSAFAAEVDSWTA